MENKEIREIQWTPRSLTTYLSIIDYLDTNWSKKSVDKFINITKSKLNRIADFPEMYHKVSGTKIRQALITKQVILFYVFNDSTLTLLTFWDTRQNPENKEIIFT
jgi:plasmid stabilization system protein ParE